MLTSRTRLLLTLVGAGLAGATLAQPASAVTQRYASPAGSGTDCSSADPCSIREAVEDAVTGDEVIVNPGDYPLTTTLQVPAPITIHGVAGEPRPRLMFSGGPEGLRLTHSSTLRYVEVDQADPGKTALFAGSSSVVDQVIAKASGPGVTAHIQSSTIRNSIVLASGSNAVAIQTSTTGGTSTSTYRNVTAIANGSGGIAIKVSAGFAAGKATVNLLNVIARGAHAGLEARTDSSGAQATISAWYSNFADPKEVGTYADVVAVAGNQSAAPLFVNWAAGDYRQTLASPTINAGIGDPANGTFDLDGDPRAIGATDIGADEFVVEPAAATTGPASAVTDRSATLSGSVNPNGSPTSYRFEYGPTTAYGRSTPAVAAGSGKSAVPAVASLDGLGPATTYHYRVVATNAGGPTKGSDQTFTTASPPPPAPASPPRSSSSPPPPPPAFAGVRLVATRLSFGGRSITLRLSCPAGTVGRCTGRTKLSARRRTSSGAARSVTLGRAPFSIASGRQAKVRVRVSRAGRRLLSRTRRLRGRASSAARDGAGQSKTTGAAVTIRRRPR
jgi:hypothetical protein